MRFKKLRSVQLAFLEEGDLLLYEKKSENGEYAAILRVTGPTAPGAEAPQTSVVEVLAWTGEADGHKSGDTFAARIEFLFIPVMTAGETSYVVAHYRSVHLSPADALAADDTEEDDQ